MRGTRRRMDGLRTYALFEGLQGGVRRSGYAFTPSISAAGFQEGLSVSLLTAGVAVARKASSS